MFIFIDDSNEDYLIVVEKPTIDYLPEPLSSYRKRPVPPGYEFQSMKLITRLKDGDDTMVGYRRARETVGYGIPYDVLKKLPSGEWLDVDDQGNVLHRYPGNLNVWDELLDESEDVF